MKLYTFQHQVHADHRMDYVGATLFRSPETLKGYVRTLVESVSGMINEMAGPDSPVTIIESHDVAGRWQLDIVTATGRVHATITMIELELNE